MTRSVIFPERVRPFLRAAGVTTFHMGPVPCILAVRTSLHSPRIMSCSFSDALNLMLAIWFLPPVIAFGLTLLFCTITCSPLSLPGLALGGLWGLREGSRKPLAVSNSRLRINAILNSITRRGTFVGNSAGVLGERHNLRQASLFVLTSRFSSAGL